MVDIATRVWNHKWKIDPIVRSMIDTDFYKLLMCQSIFRNKPDAQVRFSLINRTTSIRLAELIEPIRLREEAAIVLERLGFDDQDLRQGSAMDLDLHTQAPLGWVGMTEQYGLVESEGDR